MPRSINGKTMLDRFEKWHHQNPEQLAKGIVSSSMVAGMLYDCVLSSASSDSVQHIVGVFRMSPEEQEIERLERQINSLRRKQIFDGVEPKAKYGIPRNKETASMANTKGIGEIAKEICNGPITKATVRLVDKEPVMDNSKQKAPENPFSNIPEAHYVPPNTKNFGAPAEKIPKEKETA